MAANVGTKSVRQPVPKGYWLDSRDMLMAGVKFFGDTEVTKDEYNALFKIPLVDRRDALAKMRDPAAAEVAVPA
jgi:hypothetical protein